MGDRYCPLMEGYIHVNVCFNIHQVVEDMAPDWVAPEKAVKHKDRNKICLSCENHVFDEPED